jgi:hypothetical protein
VLTEDRYCDRSSLHDINMRNLDFRLFPDSKHAIVMEPTIKSISFMKFLKKSAIALLKSNKYKPKSIKLEGFYLIIFLHDDLQLVQAIELLRKISGLLYIFIGVVMNDEYVTLSRSVLSLANKLLLNGEKYLIKIETSKLAESKDDTLHILNMILSFLSKLNYQAKH